MTYNNNHPVMITLRVHQWHEYIGSNKQLCNCTEDTLSKSKIMPCGGNIVDYPGLVTSWIMEEGTQMPLY